MKALSAMLLALCLTAAVARAAQPAASDPWDDYDEVAFMDMDLDQNIATPALAKEEKHPVRNYMRNLAMQIARQKYNVEMERDDEVIVVTIPTDELFLPNDTLLSPRAPQRLKPLLGYLKDPGMFKLVYAVHTDDTGSQAYLLELSQQRVNSLYDWFLDFVDEDLVIVPYAMGDIDPLFPNDSRRGRAANRRVELYLIPGPEMILRARKGKI